MLPPIMPILLSDTKQGRHRVGSRRSLGSHSCFVGQASRHILRRADDPVAEPQSECRRHLLQRNVWSKHLCRLHAEIRAVAWVVHHVRAIIFERDGNLCFGVVLAAPPELHGRAPRNRVQKRQRLRPRLRNGDQNGERAAHHVGAILLPAGCLAVVGGIVVAKGRRPDVQHNNVVAINERCECLVCALNEFASRHARGLLSSASVRRPGKWHRSCPGSKRRWLGIGDGRGKLLDVGRLTLQADGETNAAHHHRLGTSND